MVTAPASIPATPAGDVVVQATPIMVGAKGAGRLFEVSDSQWRRLSAAGLVPAPAKICGSVRWNVQELIEWARVGCPSRARWVEQRTLRRIGGVA